jgi:ADP-heptose:LPS heptosyltransferase
MYAGLFDGDDRLDHVVAYEDVMSDPSMIPQGAFDGVIDVQNNRRSKQLIARIAPKARVERFDKLHWKRWLLLLMRINTYRADDTVMSRYLKVAEPFVKIATGQPADTHRITQSPHLTAQWHSGGRDDEWESRFGDKPVLALFPSAAWKNKQWPLEFFMQVGSDFVRRGWAVFVCGGPDDCAEIAALTKAIGPSAWGSVGAVPLEKTAAMIKRCALALGNDSGLVHLARAVGVKTGIVFGPTTRHWGFFPEGNPPSRAFEAAHRCRPCHPHGGNVCLRGKRVCLLDVTPQMVVKGLMEL